MVYAVLFDIDGTLIDSNNAHASAWVDALEENGRTVAFDAVRPLIGMGGDKLLPALTGVEPESDEGKAIAHRRAAIFKVRYLPAVRPTNGANALVRALGAAGLTLAVATSAKSGEVAALLNVADAAHLFAAATSSDDAERSKPDPDIVYATLGELDIYAPQAVMLGDTPYDVAAARQAGVSCIVLRCGGGGPTRTSLARCRLWMTRRTCSNAGSVGTSRRCREETPTLSRDIR